MPEHESDGAVVAEFVGADSGLDYAMMMATSDLNIARQFDAILLLSMIGVIFFWFISYVGRTPVDHLAFHEPETTHRNR